MERYIAQRLAAIGEGSEIESLKAENARLKQRLEQVPAANFKSDIQAAFEQSPEFESILNAFFFRFMREKFGAEFQDSAYIQEFQIVANKAFADFEEKYKREAPKNAHGNKGTKRTGAADSGENQGE